MLDLLCLGFLNCHPINGHGQFCLGSFGPLCLLNLLIELELSDALFDHIDPFRLIHLSGAEKLDFEIYSFNLTLDNERKRLTLTRYAMCPDVSRSGEWSQFLFLSSLDFFLSLLPDNMLFLLF